MTNDYPLIDEDHRILESYDYHVTKEAKQTLRARNFTQSHVKINNKISKFIDDVQIYNRVLGQGAFGLVLLCKINDE